MSNIENNVWLTVTKGVVDVLRKPSAATVHILDFDVFDMPSDTVCFCNGPNKGGLQPHLHLAVQKGAFMDGSYRNLQLVGDGKSKDISKYSMKQIESELNSGNRKSKKGEVLI